MNSDHERNFKVSFILQLPFEMRSSDQLSMLTNYLYDKSFFPEIRDKETLSEISRHLSLRVLQRDEMLFSKGDNEKNLFVVLNGSISYYKTPPNE